MESNERSKVLKVLMDTRRNPPPPHVFAQAFEQHIDEAMARGFSGIEIRWWHAGRELWFTTSVEFTESPGT